jgi:hypothetical protein
MDTFAILNTLALGTLAGTITGLAIGFVGKRHGSSWTLMSRRDKAVSVALVLIFSAVFCGILFWYELAGF